MSFQDLAQQRPDLAFIAHWIKPQAHVLDIGCGDGIMLDYLQTEKSCTGYGIEIADDKVLESTQRGVLVLQQDMEKGLSLFANQSFDVVLCLSSLQMTENVEGTLQEFARVGREVIVSFPNFAYWQHRLALIQGHMPVSKSLPFQWYNTPNLRCATIGDFAELANKVGLVVKDCLALHDGHPVTFWPNLRGNLALFRLSKP